MKELYAGAPAVGVGRTTLDRRRSRRIASLLVVKNPRRPSGARKPNAGVGYDFGVKINIATLFDGKVTCSDLPEIEQLEASSG